MHPRQISFGCELLINLLVALAHARLAVERGRTNEFDLYILAKKGAKGGLGIYRQIGNAVVISHNERV